MILTRYRVRLLAVCLALVAATFLQAPGRIVADTKLDLAVDPGGFLERSLHLWEPLGYFGQLQNQAYGYLFPMGPFFLGGHLLHLDPWVVQRLWWSTLLVVAFLGAVRLARLLDIGSPGSRVVAGLAYALAPRMLSELGAISAETLPFVLLPWVLVPLVRYRRGELSAWPAVARSALAVLAMGGINGAATLMVLPLPLLYILTRGAVVRRTLLWRWVVACGAAVLWWVVPLFLLGMYSYPFLGYIETAAQTTANTSLVEVLRGTSHWLGYLVLHGQPVWPSAWTLVTSPALIMETALLAGLGLAGIAHVRCPERRFLAIGAVVGLLLLTAGHLGPFTGPQAASVHGLLDAALAPFRNVHKFDAVLRLPVVLGLAHLGSLVPRSLSATGRVRTLAVAAVGVLVVGSAAPLLAGLVPARGTYEAIPPAWQKASAWLTAHDGSGRALIVPAAGDGAYLWGEPRDEPLAALGTTPWAVRDAVPLGSAGTTRLLDAWTTVIDSGAGSPGLAPSLARAGVRYLVVRNDLDLAFTGAPVPERVQTSLAQSPDLTLVASFGSRDAEGAGLPGAESAPFGLGTAADRFPAVQVYEVDVPTSQVSALPLDGLTAVSGGPEALVELAAVGQLPAGPFVLDGDLTAGAAAALAAVGRTAVPRIATDTLRHRVVRFGEVRDNAGPTLQADATPGSGGLPLDVLPFQGTGFQTNQVIDGAAEVSASSTAAAGGEPGIFDPAGGPLAAFDDDPATAWTSGATGSAVGQYLQVRLTDPRPVSLVSVDVRNDSVLQARVRALTVRTDAGVAVVPVPAGGGLVVAHLPGGTTTTVTITVTSADSTGPDPRVRLDGVEIPGVVVTSALQLPTAVPPGTAAGAPSTIVVARADGSRSDCLLQSGAWMCVPGLARGVEDGSTWRRDVDLASQATYSVSGTLVAKPGPGLDVLLRQGRLVTADVSSTVTADPAVRGDAAVDGDPTTTWVSGTKDANPALTLRWLGLRPVGELTLWTNPSLHVARPTRVEVTAGGVSTIVTVGGAGTVRFPSVRTDHLVIRVLARSAGETVLPSFDEVPLPVGVTEVTLAGVTPTASLLDRVVTIPCSSGPVVRVGPRLVETTATTTERDLVTGRPVPFIACGQSVVAARGAVQLVGTSTDALTVESIVMRTGEAGMVPSEPRPVDTVSWSGSERELRVGPGTAAVLSVPENANRGWVATLDGAALQPLRLDGWEQGYLLPAGQGGLVVLRFTPETPFRWALALGALAALGLLVLALRPRRAVPATREEDALSAAPGPRRAAWVGVAAALALLGGVGGVLVGGLAAVLGARRPGRAPWLVAGCVGTAGLLVASNRWTDLVPPALAWPSQALCLAAVGGLLGAVVLARLPEAVQGPLDEPPAGGSQSDAERRGERQHDPEAAGERVSVQQSQHQVEGQQVPEE